MAAVSLLWNNNMAAMTPCENALLEGVDCNKTKFLFLYLLRLKPVFPIPSGVKIFLCTHPS